MALANLFPQNGWKAEGALGGLLAGEQYGYGLEQLRDEKRLRDLEYAVKDNEYQESLLDKPVNASNREVKLAEAPTKKAKASAELENYESGRWTRGQEADVAGKEELVRKQKYAEDALERGEWLDSVAPMLDSDQQLGMDSLWKDALSRRPKSMTYVPDGPLTADTRARLKMAHKAWINSAPQVRAMALQTQKDESDERQERTRQEGQNSRAALAARTSTENAKIRAKAPEAGPLAMQKIGKFVSTGKDDPDNPLTAYDITAAESMLQKAGSKEGDAAKVDAILSILMAGKNRATMSVQQLDQLHRQAVRATYPPEGRRQLEMAEKYLGLGSVPPLSPEQEKALAAMPAATPTTQADKVPGSKPNPAAAPPAAAPESVVKRKPQPGEEGNWKENGKIVGRYKVLPDGTIQKTRF